jgi:hypothetical protein
MPKKKKPSRTGLPAEYYIVQYLAAKYHRQLDKMAAGLAADIIAEVKDKGLDLGLAGQMISDCVVSRLGLGALVTYQMIVAKAAAR